MDAKERSERRAYPRWEIARPVSIWQDGAPAPICGRSENLSDCGCFLRLEAPAKLEDGQTLQIELKIPRQTPNTFFLETLRTPARIQRIHEAGVALAFTAVQDLQLE